MAGIAIPECLLVPLYVGGSEPIGTLWVVSSEVGNFSECHALILTDLAEVCGLGLETVKIQAQLKSALQGQETLTREMAHRVKNLISIADGLIRLTARTATEPSEMADALSGRLHALAAANALVLRSIRDERLNSSDLAAVINAVLAPYDHANISVEGETVTLGEQSISSIALIIHELATNAVKYGAFSSRGGSLSVSWQVSDGIVHFTWREVGEGLLSSGSDDSGFGGSLIKRTAQALGSTFEYK